MGKAKVLFLVVFASGIFLLFFLFSSCMGKDQIVSSSSSSSSASFDVATTTKANMPSFITGKIKKWKYKLYYDSFLVDEPFELMEAEITPDRKVFKYSSFIFPDNSPRVLIITGKETKMINLKTGEEEKLPEEFYNMPFEPEKLLDTKTSLLKEGFKLEGSTNKEDIYVKRIYDRENKIEAKERVYVDKVAGVINRIHLEEKVDMREINRKLREKLLEEDIPTVPATVTEYKTETEIECEYEEIEGITLPKKVDIIHKVGEQELKTTLTFETQELEVEK